MKQGTAEQRARLARLIRTHRKLAERVTFYLSEGFPLDHPVIQNQGDQHLAVLTMIDAARSALTMPDV